MDNGLGKQHYGSPLNSFYSTQLRKRMGSKALFAKESADKPLMNADAARKNNAFFRHYF